MPKIKITDPKGFFFNRVLHAEGAEIEVAAGARLDAALHFKQAEIVKEKPAKPEKDEKK